MLKFVKIALDCKNLVNLSEFLEGVCTDVPLHIAHPVVSFWNWSHWHAVQNLYNPNLTVTCCGPSDLRQTIKQDTRKAFWWKYLPFKLACEKKKWIAKMTIFLLMSKTLKLKSDITLELLWHFTKCIFILLCWENKKGFKGKNNLLSNCSHTFAHKYFHFVLIINWRKKIVLFSVTWY